MIILWESSVLDLWHDLDVQTWMYIAVPVLLYCGKRTLREFRAGNYTINIVKVMRFLFKFAIFFISPVSWNPFQVQSTYLPYSFRRRSLSQKRLGFAYVKTCGLRVQERNVFVSPVSRDLAIRMVSFEYTLEFIKLYDLTGLRALTLGIVKASAESSSWGICERWWRKIKNIAKLQRQGPLILDFMLIWSWGWHHCCHMSTQIQIPNSKAYTIFYPPISCLQK